MQLVEDQAVLAVIVFILAYAVSTALSLPGGAVLSVTGGFLFGTAFGGLWTVIGATVGATAIFLVAKTALGDMPARPRRALLQPNGGRLPGERLQLPAGAAPDPAVSLLRRQPGARPSWACRLRTYVVATFVGIIPGDLRLRLGRRRVGQRLRDQRRVLRGLDR